MNEKVEFRGDATQAGLNQSVCVEWETKDVTTGPTSLCRDSYATRYCQSPEIFVGWDGVGVDRISLYSPGWPQIHGDPPVSAS